MIIRKPQQLYGFHHKARQTGKTTMAVNEYLKDPENNLMLVYNNSMRFRVISNFRIPKNEAKNIQTVLSAPSLGVMRDGILIMDDIFLLTQTEMNKMYEILLTFKKPNKIMALSSETHLYEQLSHLTNIKYLKE